MIVPLPLGFLPGRHYMATTAPKIKNHVDNTLRIRMDPEAKRKLQAICAERGTDMSGFVRESVYERLARLKKAER